MSDGAAGERCEAFEYKEPDAAKVSQYERSGFSGNIISKMMMSLYESPVTMDHRLKEHCAVNLERSSMRQLVGALPVVNPEAHMSLVHNREHALRRQKVRACLHTPACAHGSQLMKLNVPPFFCGL